jgi:hypothetical protein
MPASFSEQQEKSLMKLRYTLPARGTLRVASEEAIRLNKWTFFFGVNKDTGYVDRLIIEISHVSEDHWPTIAHVQQDENPSMPRFPFEVNSAALRFKSFEPYVIALGKAPPVGSGRLNLLMTWVAKSS